MSGSGGEAGPTRTSRLFLDLRPLRQSPQFRRLWAGQTLSLFGSQMTIFAVTLQIYTLTHSTAAVGAMGLCTAVPSVLFGLLGGSVGDVLDRRKLVLATNSCLAGSSVLFAVQAYSGFGQVWALYVLSAVQVLLGSIGAPARRTFMPRLLPKEQLVAGAALNSVSSNLSSVAGPALAGVVAAVWGLKACYAVDVLSFAAALYGVGRLPAMPPQPGARRPGVAAVADGLHFIGSSPMLRGAFLAELSVTLLGLPTALLPAFNAQFFGGSARTFGLLSAATAVGGLTGSALSGPLAGIERRGRAMVISAAVCGAAIVGFGLARVLWLAIALLVVVGVADVCCVVLRSALVQSTTTDSYRGRTSSVEFVVGMSGPQLGGFRAGALGSLTSPAVSAVSGGLCTLVATAVIGLALPAFVRRGAAPAPAAQNRIPA